MNYQITAPGAGIQGRDAQADYVRGEIARQNMSPEGIRDLSKQYGGNRALAEQMRPAIKAATGKDIKTESVMRQIQRCSKGDTKTCKPAYKEAFDKARSKADRARQPGEVQITVTGTIKVSEDIRERTTTQYIPDELWEDIMDDPTGAFQGDIAEDPAAEAIGYEPRYFPLILNFQSMTITRGY